VSLLLEGKRAFITGGTRGIGAAICEIFAREGADVAFSYNSRDDLAADVSQKIEAHGRKAINAKVSVVDRLGMKKLVRELVEKWGGIDILVNNAGVLQMAPILEMSVENWDRTFDINVRALFVSTQTAGAVMRDQPMIGSRRGTIINMASMGGKVGAPNQAHYAASKAAVISFTQVTAMEFGPFGVTANCICPGYVLTEMGAATRTPEMIAAWSAKSPLGRLAEPSDVAKMALFLASDDASYCTGQAMNVSGGMVMH